MPAPGFSTLTSTSPMMSAAVVSTSKYTRALTASRPTRAVLPICAMPVTTVQKMSGAINTRIALMNASPRGCMAVPARGFHQPSAAPMTMAIST
jgi:hypothetical protein